MFSDYQSILETLPIETAAFKGGDIQSSGERGRALYGGASHFIG